MQIAEYEAKRARELVAVWRASFEHGVRITDPHPIEDQLNFFLREVVPNNKIRVALDESAIVALRSVAAGGGSTRATSQSSGPMSCQTDSDCRNGQSCRSRKGGGTECRARERESSAIPSAKP
jgi:hypothetical protein